MNRLNKLITSYEQKKISVELTAQNIERLIGCILLAITDLNNSNVGKLKEERIQELKKLLHYLESID